MSRTTLYKLARAGLFPANPKHFKPCRRRTLAERMERDGWIRYGASVDKYGREIYQVYCRDEIVTIPFLNRINIYPPMSPSPAYCQWGKMIRRYWARVHVEDERVIDDGYTHNATKDTKIQRYSDDITDSESRNWYI